MSEALLQTILQEIQSVKTEVQSIKSDLQSVKSELQTVKAQTDENTQLLKAIITRQEETDAKLENMAMDMHKMQGDITFLNEQVAIAIAYKKPLDEVITEFEDAKIDIKLLKKLAAS